MLLLGAVFAHGLSQPTMGVAVQAQASPLGKVVTLLEEMKAQCSTEAEEDAKAYEQYKCWCTKNDREKNGAIKEAERRIADFTAFLEEAAATEAQLKTEIEGLAADIKEDQESLATAEGVRAKDKADFETSEADMKETLAALKGAVDILSKVQLLQKGKGGDAKATAKILLQIRGAVEKKFPQFKEVMQRDLFDVLGSMQGVKKGAAFLSGNPNYWESSEEQAGKDAKANGLEGAAAGAKSFNSRSGQIFGVLRSMNDQFLRDLDAAQKSEFQALVQYEQLHAAKTGEIASASAQKEAKETHLADLMNQAAKARDDLKATKGALSADEQFLMNLKESCATEANEYESRSQVRSEEIRALAETLKILTDDESRSLFGKTMNFLQVQSIAGSISISESTAAAQDRAADRAMKRLAEVAKRHKNWALVSLAVRVRLDAFTKVIAMLDKMSAELKSQQQEEFEKNDYCKKSIDETEDKIWTGKNTEEDLNEKHQQVTNSLQVLAENIEQMKADVAADEVSLKQAGEARKAENQVFQTTISDQRATVNILSKALARLQEFYGGAQLVEVRAHGAQEPGANVEDPPPKPKDYQKSGGAGGALQMMMKIVSDVQAEEAATAVDEQNAQKAYSTLVSDTKASIEADRDAIAKAEADTAEASTEKSETEEAQMANGEELTNLNSLLGAHHLDCDWLLKFYDVRQQARGEEMDAIADAKAILSGADFQK